MRATTWIEPKLNAGGVPPCGANVAGNTGRLPKLGRLTKMRCRVRPLTDRLQDENRFSGTLRCDGVATCCEARMRADRDHKAGPFAPIAPSPLQGRINMSVIWVYAAPRSQHKHTESAEVRNARGGVLLRLQTNSRAPRRSLAALAHRSRTSLSRVARMYERRRSLDARVPFGRRRRRSEHTPE